MNKITLFFIICTVSFKLCYAQTKGITPMHLFFKNNADSTIIIEYDTQSYDPNYYNILTKTGDTINAFQYYAIQKAENVLMPKKLRALILMEKFRYEKSEADINPYFTLAKLDEGILSRIWAKTGKLSIWKMVDDKQYPDCPNNKQGLAIADGGKIIIHLITQNKINTLIYNIPWHYEKYCPGNKNRQSAIKLCELFEKYFPKK